MSAPTDWMKGRLGAQCSIGIGGTPSRNIAEYWDTAQETTNRWVSIRDLSRRTISHTAENISDLGVRHSNVKLQPQGTILLSFKLSIGRVAFAGVPLYTNEAIAGLRSEEIDHTFLYYGLQQWDLLQGVDQAIKGATLNKAKLKNIEYTFPPSIPEQTKIAEILTAVDRAIEQTEALVAKQQRIKTGLMQDLLTRGIDEHGDLRTEQTHAFKDSPLGRIPVEWEVGSLMDITSRSRQAILTGPFGADLGLNDFVEEGTPVLRIGNVQHRFLDLNELLFVTPGKAAKLARYSVKVGDILFARQGATTGRNSLATEAVDGWLINYHIIRVALDRDLCSPLFIEAILNSDDVVNQVSKEKGRGTREGINTAQLKALQFRLPPRSEQERIAEAFCVQATTDRMNILLRSKLCALKTALMQDLLTGRKRVTGLLS